jgi:hypothetical protein
MIFASAVVVVVGAVVAIWIGSRRQQNSLSTSIDRLVHAGAAGDTAAQPSSGIPDDLPAPVQRYLRWALPTPRLIREVRLKQVGRLRTDGRSKRWIPFEAEHMVIPSATGFVWNARVGVAPLVHVRVLDALIEGQGSGHVSLLSAFTVAADAGTPEMNSGSLHRYLAEAVWYPTALLPGPKLKWTAIDATKALATLTDHGVSVSLEFRFANTGEVAGIYTPTRWGKFPEGYRQVPWEGHFRDYKNQDGVFVPMQGDVGWYVDETRQTVWKGTITAFQLRTDSPA